MLRLARHSADVLEVLEQRLWFARRLPPEAIHVMLV